MIAKRMLVASLFSTLILSLQLQAQDKAPKASYTMIKNVKIFDGVNDRLPPGSVLVESNLIKDVGANIQAPTGATVIDGGERTLMPGLDDDQKETHR